MEEDQLLSFLRTVSPTVSVDGALPHVGSQLDDAMASILSSVCKEMDASHCVFWEASVDLDPRADTPTGRLYAVHSTFPNEQRIRHAAFPADLVHDFTGRNFWAATKQRGEPASFDNDMLAADQRALSTPFLREQELVRGCTARWQFGDENSGAISVYRGVGTEKFAAADAEKLARLALYVPKLLNLATNQFVVDLMSNVLDALYGGDSAPSRPNTQEARSDGLDRVCRLLTDMFVCKEASVFLATEPRRGGTYHLTGSNFSHAQIRRQSYAASLEDGLTGYVLASRQPVVVFAEDKLDDVSDYYQGIRWTNGAGLSSEQRAWSDAPRGFLGVPIFGLETPDEKSPGEKAPLLGVVRCSIRTGRYYFSRRDTEILQIIARLIGVWRVRWLSARNRAERQQLWENMAQISDSLNEQVHRLLSGIRTLNTHEVIPTTQRQLAEIYDSAVQQLRQACGGLTVVAFRQATVLTSGARQFKARSCHPGEGAIAADDMWRSAAEEAVSKDEPVAWCSKNGSSDQDTVLVCAPVSIADTHFGVLDFVFADAETYEALSDSLRPWVRTIGRQLALCEFLIQQVIRLEELKASQVQTYANMAHQLRSPLLTAIARAKLCLDYAHSRESVLPRHLTGDLEKLAGACRRTKRVADTMETLARLVQGRKVTPKLENVSPEQILRFGREMLEDQMNRHADKLLRVECTLADDIRRLHRHSVRCDPRFIQQALDAAIDNAFKYSADNSTIRFEIRRGARFELLVRVTNTGVRLTAEDATRCTERAFRGQEAQEVDHDGSGLGLWLAKALMELQSGRIKAYPTNDQGETIVEIVGLLVVTS